MGTEQQQQIMCMQPPLAGQEEWYGDNSCQRDILAETLCNNTWVPTLLLQGSTTVYGKSTLEEDKDIKSLCHHVHLSNPNPDSVTSFFE